MRNLMSALAVLTLSVVGCKDRSDYDGPPSAQKQVEMANEESAAAYERAREAQERAADEAEEAARAQDKVREEREDLAEAEAKAAASTAEARAAQEAAMVESEAAHAEAQQLNARAAELQRRSSEVAVTTERVDVIDPYTGEPVVTPDLNDDYAAMDAEVQRLQAQIDAAIARVVHGSETRTENVFERFNRYAD